MSKRLPPLDRDWIVKVCQACGYVHLNAQDNFCKFTCGMFLSHSMSLDEVGVLYGLNLCPHCVFWYWGFANNCKFCSLPLIPFVLPEFPGSMPKEEILPCPVCSNTQLQTNYCDFCGRMRETEIEYFDRNDFRPTMLITLRNNNGFIIKHPVLVDTGASITLLHGYVASFLRLSMTDNKIEVSGIAPNATITAFEAPVEIALTGGKFYETRAYFSWQLPLTTLGMLGHDGFLDRFLVQPENAKKRIIIKEDDVLQSKLYRYCQFCGTERKNASSLFCAQCGDSLLVPSKIWNGSLYPHLQSNTKGQPMLPVPIHGYQLTSTMQVQSEIEEEN